MTTLQVLDPGNKLVGVGLPDFLEGDWAEGNEPWRIATAEQLRDRWPLGVIVVPLNPLGGSFWGRVEMTLAQSGNRVVIELDDGVYHLDSFRMAGSSGDPTYSFGLWFGSKLRGFVSKNGADKTAIQMDASSMTQAQLDKMATMESADFSPLQMGMCRFDAAAGSPVILSGITFRAADQQMLTMKGAGVASVLPQPAPHQGVIIYSGGDSIVTYCRFQAAARALTSAPPFETGNLNSQRGNHIWENCEFDSRRAKELDPAQPRRCGAIMLNNEIDHKLINCWIHHTNVSRYAANDENTSVTTPIGKYLVKGCKIEQITNNRNVDPALNGGNSLLGYTNATPFGWESSNADITVEDTIVIQDNPLAVGQVPMMFQLTSVGARNPQGGRFTLRGGKYKNNGFPTVDGFIGFRIQPSTYWWLDGFGTTLFIYGEQGQRLQPYVVTGTWPPTEAALAAANVTPATNYLVRQA